MARSTWALAVLAVALALLQVVAALDLIVPNVTQADPAVVGTFAATPAVCDQNQCFATCVGYSSCQSCYSYCHVASPKVGGDGLAVFLLFLPIIVLLFLTLKPNPWDSVQSLPTAAFVLFIVRLGYMGNDPINTCAAVVAGIFEVFTPISIIAGAIFLFDCMNASGCMAWIMRELKAMSGGHPVAEVMLIGWAFAYMIEGASGFGTPVALASPMLVQLGHDPFAAVACCLLTNTLATVFGAVGTPVWFGFAALNLGDEGLQQVGFQATVGVACASLIVPLMAVNILVPLKTILKNAIFFYLSVASCIVPALVVSLFSYEFGSILGGMIGCLLTAVLIRFRVGLVGGKDAAAGESAADLVDPAATSVPMGEKRGSLEYAFDTADTEDDQPKERVLKERETGGAYVVAALLRTFPLTGTVVLLILTRIEQIGLKGILKAKDPAFIDAQLATLMKFRVSNSLVLQFNNILTDPTVSSNYETFYTPSILPFFTIGLITCFIHYRDMDIGFYKLFANLFTRVGGPFKSLIGAMILVGLFRNGGNMSPAYVLGSTVSGWLGVAWIALAAILGILGSFFSGSTTISNLTFAQVQYVAAQNIGVNPYSILALQAIGGTAGNAVCINNIISAKAVNNLNHIGEGAFIMKTAPAVAVFWLVATAGVTAIFILADLL